MLFTGELFRKELAREGGPSIVGKRHATKGTKTRARACPERKRSRRGTRATKSSLCEEGQPRSAAPNLCAYEQKRFTGRRYLRSRCAGRG